MPKIKVLPENVARKIAAGEVIERPASVVKELCENAFDARANSVEIEIWDGGLSLIRIRDDGCGMSPEDLKICYLPHATSKIEKEDDLLRIKTWGFRGEALSSIAAVSELTISSREKDALIGARLKVRFGKEISFVERGLAPGTIVEVANLFANVPARRAFLKSPRAETMRVSEISKLLALENPQVNLTLKTSGKEIFNYQARKGRLGLLAELAGLCPEDFLVEEIQQGELSLSIIISKPQAFFSSARYIYLLVNNRVVRDKLLMSAAFEGLKALFPKGRYPALVLALFLPPELVDVNVHPAKWEVRFRREREVFSLVKNTFEKLFKPSVSFTKKELENVDEDIPIYKTPDPETTKESFLATKVAEAITSFSWEKEENLEVLSPFGPEFFLILFENELYIFDYHAAHERLLFEKWKKELKDGLNTQKLLIPQVLKVRSSKIEELLPALNAVGFEIDFFGEDKLILRAYPALLGKEAKEILEAFLEEENFFPENMLEEIISRLSCKAAKKAGEKISSQEIKSLFKEVRQMNLTHCPHGRPFYLKISPEDVRKKLGRKI
ncbi:DNA mismatch repair endonuclease MutL [Thermodesulfatator atlanticus]|uniref:DNA mismatch repair endonuclease MutL n=1 Tax=Thermodesulfatator atlanticus TaxID=501497 RepID=UPI0003B7AEAD|nr:DNA mismatch repair endonuclease MutL [Thermodesulfatator atlanticus]